MAETKKEVVESTTQQEEPKLDTKVEKLKVKKPKMKKFEQPEDNIIKVDLSKPPKTEEVEEEKKLKEPTENATDEKIE